MLTQRPIILKKNVEYRNDVYEIQHNQERLKIVHLFDPPHLLKGT